MAFVSRLKQLPKGTLRLLIFTSLTITILLFLAAIITNNGGILTLSITSFFIFWIIARAVLWVKDGYKQDEEK